MTKTQKIWLGISAAMFVAPEALWSPVGNLMYSLFIPSLNGYAQILRNSFLFDYRYENLLKIVLFVQLAGSVLFFLGWLRIKNKIKSRLIFGIILMATFLLCLVSLFAFYFGVIFNISF